ncbi:C40 family peptidase [Vogesella urethralis]|mgnify:FL=1|uniref:C40 family peptidase n=1 Tax=Vogesella urethralis TaxID=2592656 RepID=UPI0011851A19|nr:C40 family peptidase [Vogesella urethralis]
MILLSMCLPSLGASHVAPITPEQEPPAVEAGGSSDLVGALLLQAMSLTGIAYRFGGNSPATGFDCSGLIRYVFLKAVGMNLPRTAAEQARQGRSVARNELKAGDIVFFDTRGFRYSHSGIYLGNGKFIHAPRTGKNIGISDMTLPYWVKRFNGARRVLTPPNGIRD